MMETGRASRTTLSDAENAPNTMPIVDLGDMSPYPTVVMVIMAHQMDFGIVLNFVSSS